MRQVDLLHLLLVFASVFVIDGCRRKPVASGEALWRAVRLGDMKLLETLVAEGADVNVTDDQGRTPLHVAVRRCNEGWVEFFATNGADLEARDRNGHTPMDLAVDEGNQRIVEILFAAGSPATIHAASYLGDVQEIRRLVQAGADVNARTAKRYTPLQLAARMGYAKTASVLLELGADLHAGGPPFGQTPMNDAAGRGHRDVVEILVLDLQLLKQSSCSNRTRIPKLWFLSVRLEAMLRSARLPMSKRIMIFLS